MDSSSLVQPELINFLDKSGSDIVLTQNRENRTMSALNVSMDENQIIKEVYQGKLLDPSDPEALGIFKITSPNIVMVFLRV